eukprot:8091-Heterococcus_DN1.PRE.6
MVFARAAVKTAVRLWRWERNGVTPVEMPVFSISEGDRVKFEWAPNTPAVPNTPSLPVPHNIARLEPCKLELLFRRDNMELRIALKERLACESVCANKISIGALACCCTHCRTDEPGAKVITATGEKVIPHLPSLCRFASADEIAIFAKPVVYPATV